jgi:short-subunit dehydrogenase
MKGTVLITGASGGIGWELALLFVKDGFQVVAVARNEEKLKALQHMVKEKYQADLDYVATDLIAPNAVENLLGQLTEKNVKIDYLVNNAGFGQYGFYLETDAREEQEMITLNISVLTHLTKALLPGMVARKQGGVLNVASTAAFQPGPLMAVYYATKAYVLSYSEALANEMIGTGVTVTALCPGPTATGFETRANLGSSKLFQKGVMDVQTVARIGYDGFLNKKTMVIPGMKNSLLSKFVRFVPRKLVTKVVRSMQETRRK